LIVSNEEIRRVLALASSLRIATRRQTVAATAAMSGQPSLSLPSTSSADESRLSRVCALRDLVAEGAYELNPDMIADKIIGRAVCDQISPRLVE